MQPYTCKELISATKSGVAKLIYNKNSVSFKLNELHYLLVTIDIFANQLARYGLARNDVMSHVIAATGAEDFVKPGPEAYKYFPYDALFDEINVIMQRSMSAKCNNALYYLIKNHT